MIEEAERDLERDKDLERDLERDKQIRLAIPVSGGIDSLILADRNPQADLFFIDYGQPYLEAERRTVELLYPNRVITICVEGLDTSVDYVPARNLIIASLCAQKADKVFIGGLADDGATDQSQRSADQMTEILSDQSGHKVCVEMPLIHLSKAEAVSSYLGEVAGLNRTQRASRLKLTYSCYSKGMDHCGKCGACFRRWVALKANGIDVSAVSIPLMIDYLARLHTYHPHRIWAILKAINSDLTPVYNIDIDGVLTIETEGRSYIERSPNIEAIATINNLAIEGAWIVLNTARAEWDRVETVQWLREHGVGYHSLLMGKLPSVKLVDDKAVTKVEDL